jgi:hypothetical protein
MKSLVILLKEPTNVNDLARIQICRAIGNLCYYNNNGRLSLYNIDNGLSIIFQLLNYCTTNWDTNLSDDQRKEKNTLILVSLGCLHNITNDNDILRKAAYKLNIIGALKQFIPFLKNNLETWIHFSSCIENLLELDEGKSQFVEEKFALTLFEQVSEEIKHFDLHDNDSEQIEDFFSILSFIGEQKMSKTYLCQTDFLKNLIKLMETSIDNNELLRHSGLFIATLLVNGGDKESDEIFNYESNLILNKSIQWLNDPVYSKKDQLIVTSSVIIANYTTNGI